MGKSRFESSSRFSSATTMPMRPSALCARLIARWVLSSPCNPYESICAGLRRPGPRPARRALRSQRAHRLRRQKHRPARSSEWPAVAGPFAPVRGRPPAIRRPAPGGGFWSRPASADRAARHSGKPTHDGWPSERAANRWRRSGSGRRAWPARSAGPRPRRSRPRPAAARRRRPGPRGRSPSVVEHHPPGHPLARAAAAGAANCSSSISMVSLCRAGSNSSATIFCVSPAASTAQARRLGEVTLATF